MALVDIRGLSVDTRLQEIFLTLEAGEMLGVIGPNGAGKSTLLAALAGNAAFTGSIEFDGQALNAISLRERACKIGFLPQSCETAWALSVADVVSLGRLPWEDEARDTGLAAVAAAMTATGIEAFATRKVEALSGGERARVWLARVLAGCPRLLLADEPVASLDLFYQHDVMSTLRRHAGAGQAVMLAIHDFVLAERYCDKLCLLQNGRIYAAGHPAEVLTEANLTAVFRLPMRVDLAAIPPVIAPVF
ncbi:MAG: ABC transporter ATP-binding protein [Zoogloeaceae bacterium]|jgi:iron complex transport system ATP-binding protein|nr:ABC transporter ATP-binding protein [Zoogloeaceae bacterium]